MNELCEVLISVALNEDGLVECMVADSPYVRDNANYTRWMKLKREDKKLWTIKTFRLNVSYPISYEQLVDTGSTLI